MTWNELIEELRFLLQDETARKWNDDDLTKWLNEAQEAYVKKTACLLDVMEIIPDATSGEFFYPDNFLEFVYGYNYNDLPILPSTYEALADANGDSFSDIVGSPEYIYDDDADDNNYHLHPNPEVTTNGDEGFDFSADQEFGIVQSFDDGSGKDVLVDGDEFGMIYSYGDGDLVSDTANQEEGIIVARIGETYSQEEGIIVVGTDEGIVAKWQEWFIESAVYEDIWNASIGEVVLAIYLPGGPIGQMQYVRKPISDTIEVSDTEPLKYFAASMAFSQETAWKDLNYAQALMNEFLSLATKESPVADIKQSKGSFM